MYKNFKNIVPVNFPKLIKDEKGGFMSYMPCLCWREGDNWTCFAHLQWTKSCMQGLDQFWQLVHVIWIEQVLQNGLVGEGWNQLYDKFDDCYVLSDEFSGGGGDL